MNEWMNEFFICKKHIHAIAIKQIYTHELFSSLWWTLISFSNDITTFTNEYDSFLFVQQYDSGKDQKKLTSVYHSGWLLLTRW
jgi:hypothetical protein